MSTPATARAPTPIHVIITRMARMPLSFRIHHVRSLVSIEPARSVRRGELEGLLKTLLTQQLKKENRAAPKLN